MLRLTVAQTHHPLPSSLPPHSIDIMNFYPHLHPSCNDPKTVFSSPKLKDINGDYRFERDKRLHGTLQVPRDQNIATSCVFSGCMFPCIYQNVEREEATQAP